MTDDELKSALRYVTKRANAKGGLRWYWQRRGFQNTRLPDDLPSRVAKAHALNTDADGMQHVVIDTMDWLISTYRASEGYQNLRPSSRKAYEYALAEIEAMWGTIPVAGITRRVVMEYRDSIEKAGIRALYMAVLKQLLNVGVDYGLLERNPAAAAKVGKSSPRREVWSEEQIACALDHCDPEFRLPLLLMLYTAQRPSDVLAMRWQDYDGHYIHVRQIKTGAVLDVPVHTALKSALDTTERRGFNICLDRHGRPFLDEHGAPKSSLLTTRFYYLRQKHPELAGLQLRDLRRTAVVHLARSGCDVPEICAFTGHSLANAHKILQVYLPPDKRVADSAILKLESYKDGIGN